MTTRSAPLPAASAGLFALAGVVDVAFLAVTGKPYAAPLPVMLLVGLLGLGTLGALVPARRGSRPGIVTVVVLRSISGLLAFVAFFAGAPVLVMVAEAVVIVATVVALVLMRRRPAVTMPA